MVPELGMTAMLVIPTTDRLRQEDHFKLEASLGYIVKSRLLWARQETLMKNAGRS